MSMKLYGTAMSANCSRVYIYLAEKGLDIPQVDFSPPHNELKSPEYLAKNPAGKIPLLELDDGSYIPESAAIIEYLEELFPNPPMIGRTLSERAKVRALERVVAELFPLCRVYFANMAPSFLQNLRGIAHVPAAAEAVRPTVERDLGALEAHIGDNEFLAGSLPTVADCHFYALLNAGIEKFKYVIPEQFPRLRQWYQNFGERPSASVGNKQVGFRQPKGAKAGG
jgi:glutathione S-transferase